MQLAFIEAHLAVHGYIARRDFRCCSKPTATKILAKYKALHPGWLTYSEVTKRYTCSKLPLFHLDTDAATFLAAYNILYCGSPSLLVSLRGKHKIIGVAGNRIQLDDCITINLPPTFMGRYRSRIQVGGFYCVPFKGLPFYLENNH